MRRSICRTLHWPTCRGSSRAAAGPWLNKPGHLCEHIAALCHGNDGKGKPGQAPPFAGSEWVMGSPNRMIRIPLSGLNGSVQVAGAEWNLSMPAMGAALSDDDLAGRPELYPPKLGQQGRGHHPPTGQGRARPNRRPRPTLDRRATPGRAVTPSIPGADSRTTASSH